MLQIETKLTAPIIVDDCPVCGAAIVADIHWVDGDAVVYCTGCSFGNLIDRDEEDDDELLLDEGVVWFAEAISA